jgi:phage gpG-like protein
VDAIRMEVIGHNGVAEAFARMAKTVPKAAMRGVKQAAQFISTEAKRNFRTQGDIDLTTRSGYGALGPPVANQLTSRTGALRASIHVEPIESQLAALVGPTRKYGAVHELGFDGTVQVPAHQRKVRATRGGRARFIVDVRAHSRKMHMPARPYLRPAFERNQHRVREIMARPIIEAIQRGAR